MFAFQTSPFNGGAGKNIQEFFATGNAGYVPWVKPQGYTMAYILCVGAGSSGAGGSTGASASARAGGGGGGSGGVARLLVPLHLIPDVLFVQVGKGGAGVAGNSNGTTGQRSIVSISDFAAAGSSNVLVASGAVAATAPTALGVAGSAETVFAVTNGQFANLGIFTALAGQGGGAGGANTGVAGTNITPFTVGLTCAGAGGGGVGTANTDFKGGDIVAAGVYPAIAGGIAAAGNGNNGYSNLQPFLTFGGSGGGTAGASGTGGSGGRGGIGSGGGGGGAGVTGGRGGDGGDGYVCIVCF